MHLQPTSYTFTTMGRPKLEETRIAAFRIPVRLWRLMIQAAKDRGVTINRMMWQLVEDFLVAAGYLKNKDRKRTKVGRKP